MIVFDLSRLHIMQSKLDSIVKDHSVKSGLMMEMRHGIYERQVSLRDILLMDDVFKRDEEKNKFDSFALDVILARNKFAAMPLTKEEKILLDEINSTMANAYVPQINLIDFSIYNSDVKITQEELHRTFLSQEKFIDKLKKMIQLESAATQDAVTDAATSYAEAKKSIFILGGSALLFGSLVAFFIIRLTESQAKDVNEAITELEESRERLEERVKIRTKELAYATEEALASNKAKDTFLMTMSHELRTPLNIILGYSELLEEVAENIDTKNLIGDLQKIQAAANHQLKLINSLLDISKIEGGQLEVAAEDFDIEVLVKDINSAVQPLMLKNDNSFVIECSHGIGMMYSDRMRIHQILLNILSNAAKFTTEGSVVLNISKRNNGDEIVFKVTDTGIGISEEYIKTMFDEFTQEDTSTTREYGGTGLGLSISKKLALLLNGDISVESGKNIGSSFSLILPVIYIE